MIFRVETVHDEGERYVIRAIVVDEEQANRIAQQYARRGYLTDVVDLHGALLHTYEGA